MRWRPIIVLAPGPDELVSQPAYILEERLQIGDAPAQDEGVDVVRALVRVDRLQVHHVPD